MSLIISDKHKYIFFHLPKNAGTSVSNFLLENENYKFFKKGIMFLLRTIKNKNTAYNFYLTGQNIKEKNFYQLSLKLFNSHSSVSKIQSIIEPEIFDLYHKFVVVRNPFDRFVSRYLYFKKISKKFRNYKFVEFLKWDLAADRVVNNQYQFLLNKNGQIGVDTILKFENIDTDFKKLIKIFNFKDEKLARLNFTNNDNYKKFYNKECVDLIHEYCKKDLEFFNYSF